MLLFVMKESLDPSMTLSELVERSGVPARTIRYYIAQNLLKGPLRVGRGAAYDAGHLDRLREIRNLKKKGHSLTEIRFLLEEEQEAATILSPENWWSYRLAEDVKVEIRADASPWRLRQILGFLKQFAEAVKGREED
jgi:DNA-binding transcriptional MerR regulator